MQERVKYDVEKNKFVMAKERSPTRGSLKVTLKNTPAQQERRRYNRHLTDAAAMRILAPTLYTSKPAILTDLM